MTNKLNPVHSRWLKKRQLPPVGYLLLLDGTPFGWEREFPQPAKVVPGVVAIHIETSQHFVATGGNKEHGADRFVTA